LSQRDNWYLVAFCHTANELREFELSRVQSAKLTNKKTLRVTNHQINEFFADSYGIFTGKADKEAIIRFTGFAAKIVSKETWHPLQICKFDAKTEICILHIPYHNGTELLRDVLRWGESADRSDSL
jgi:predicted DNA-binding transcriptional regulator YafY